jgi:two-component system response regulator LytT
MQVLIIEDEPRAANRLHRLVVELDPTVEVLAKIESVRAAISWLSEHESPDLIFMDVRLSDGDCFEILDALDVESPIVFSTAYGEYALRAFAANSIDYLLKPVLRSELKRALDKYRKLTGYRMSREAWPDFQVDPQAPAWRQQFLIAVAGRFTPLKTDNIIAARSYLKATQLIDDSGKEWLVEQSLSEVVASLNPSLFFQVSRQWLLRLAQIEELRRDGSGYKVKLKNLPETITVSRSRVSSLKALLKN